MTKSRGHFLQVPFTKAELQKIAKVAKEDGRSMAQWARMILSKKLK